MEMAADSFYLNDWRVDPSSDCLSRDGITVKIEARHMKVLLLLAEHAGDVISVQRIQDEVWRDEDVTQNSVHQAIAHLRRALADDSKTPRYIQAVARQGYRLVASRVAVELPASINVEAQRTAVPNSAEPASPAAKSFVRSLMSGWLPSRRWGPLLVLSSALIVVMTAIIWARLEANEASREAARADQLSNFMVRVFAAEGASPASGTKATAEELTSNAAHRVSVELRDHPELQARMLEAIGQSYANGIKSAAAVVALKEAVRIRRTTGTKAQLAKALDLLGGALSDIAKYTDAEEVFAETLILRRSLNGEQSLEYANALGSLARLDLYRGRNEHALELLSRVHKIVKAIRGTNHTAVADILTDIATAHRYLSDFPKAEEALREAVRIYSITQPDSYPLRLDAQYQLGDVLVREERLAEADDVLSAVLPVTRQVFGETNPMVALTQVTMADLRFKQGHFTEGVKLMTDAISIFAAMGAAGNEVRANAQVRLATQLLTVGEYSRSEKLLRDSIELNEPTKNARYVATAEHFLAESLLAQDRLEEAEGFVRSAIRRLKEAGDLRWRVERSTSTLGVILVRSGHASEGRQLIVESERWLATDPKAPASERSKAKARARSQFSAHNKVSKAF